jgi:hypothetical protein
MVSSKFFRKFFRVELSENRGEPWSSLVFGCPLFNPEVSGQFDHIKLVETCAFCQEVEYFASKHPRHFIETSCSRLAFVLEVNGQLTRWE